MQIVIEIPEDAYRQIRNWGVPTDKLRRKIYDIIDNGTPLPKRHGRLIDADWVKNTLDIFVINEYNGQFIRRSDIDTIPTIIEGSESE